MNIGFSTSNKVISKIIRKLTKSRVSHTYIKFEVAGEETILHATQHGVNSDYYNTFTKHNTVVAEFKLNVAKENQDKILSYVIKQLDKPYDFKSMIGFGWVIINKMFGKKIKNPFSSSSAYYCSELILEALKFGNFTDVKKFDRETTSPEDLLEFFINHPLIERVK